MEQYDSTKDTLEHISKVQKNIVKFALELKKRGEVHDRSKLEEPEKALFDKYTPLLKDLKFGSAEYQQSLENLKPALDHHYSVNDHHPEHFQLGILEMDLCSIMEMLADWKAASERTKEGDIMKSIEFNAIRFGISDQLKQILINSVKYIQNKDEDKN